MVGAYFLALWLRYDDNYTQIPKKYFYPYISFLFPFAAACIVVFFFFKMYNSMWRYASFAELSRTFAASLLTSIVHSVLVNVFYGRMPITYYVIGALFQFVFLIGIRFAFRFIKAMKTVGKAADEAGKRILLIGAGSSGQMILRDIAQSKEVIGDRVVCIIDDNPNKWHRYLDGTPIIGGRDDILKAVKDYKIDTIYLLLW